MNARKWIFTSALALICAGHATAFYNPQVGKFASRDPMEEGGGANLFAFVRNDPIGRFDAFGLCGVQCGVRSLNFISQGWTVTTTNFGFNFDVIIKYRKGNGYDPSCCQYIQWAQAKALTINGQQGATNSAGGTPLDGRLHVDSWPHLGDNDTNPSGGVYQDNDASDTGFSGHDIPGWGPFANGSVINYDIRFRGTVIDKCNGNRLVIKKDFGISAFGTWPTLHYEP